MAKTGKARGILAWAVILAMVAGLWGFSLPVYAEDAAAGTQITILHTNDVHARVDVEPYVAALAKERKAAGENVLVLSAGDVLHGQPIATLSRGKTIVDIMNAVGYDAMAPGNHDFNYGTARLEALENRMNFPILAANVKNSVGGLNTFTPYIIKEFDGVKVGIFGLATPETATKTNPNNVRTIEFTFPVTAARQMVTQLRAANCDVIIALAHLGVDGETWAEERSTALAKIAGLDLVIDGHSHTVWENGNPVNDTLLAQTGCYGENIGVVTLDVSGGRVTGKSATLIPVPTEKAPNPDFQPDAAVAKLIEDVKKSNETITAEVVASTPVLLQGEREYARARETNLGNLICDAMIAETGADIAITNGGGIRASIQAGDITKGDVLTVLPFGNYIVTKKMTGAAVLEALEHGISASPDLAGSFPQVGGIRFSFDAGQPAGRRVVQATVGGQPINPAATYTVATNDFMAVGGDDYTMIGSAGGEMIYGALDEALIEYLQSGAAIPQGPDGRITAQNAAANDMAA